MRAQPRLTMATLRVAPAEPDEAGESEASTGVSVAATTVAPEAVGSAERGPVGAEQLCSFKYLVTGDGTIRT